jgi:hypothetical protein
MQSGSVTPEPLGAAANVAAPSDLEATENL